MKVEYINPFITSSIELLKTILSEDVIRGKISLCKDITPMLGVVIIIGIAGEVKGRVIIDLDTKTALKIASIMNEEEITEMNKLASATLTELGNMIVGRAVTKLHEQGFQFDLTPPAILFGNNLSFSDEDVEALVVPLELSIGKMEINVALKENKNFGSVR